MYEIMTTFSSSPQPQTQTHPNDPEIFKEEKRKKNKPPPPPPPRAYKKHIKISAKLAKLNLTFANLANWMLTHHKYVLIFLHNTGS